MLRISSKSSMACLAMALLPLLMVTTGCGKSELKRQRAWGVVQLDQSPLAAGTIRFVPAGETRGPATVAPVKDGFFELPADVGPLVGKHRVQIEANVDPGFAIDDEAAFMAAMTAAKGSPLPPQPIPPRYNRKTTLEVEVTNDPEANTYEFMLVTDNSK